MMEKALGGGDLEALALQPSEIYDMVKDIFPLMGEMEFAFAIFKWRKKRWFTILLRPKGKIQWAKPEKKKGKK